MSAKSARKTGSPERRIESIDDFLGFLREHSKYKVVLYRGQQCDWPLVPKIARNQPEDDTEEAMLQDFKTQSVPLLNVAPAHDNDWDWLAIAQHHGMATRLLDWTDNPLVALWFAVRKPPVGDSDGTVWVLVPNDKHRKKIDSHYSPFEVQAVIAFQPTPVSPRIKVQSGWLTTQPLQADYWMDAMSQMQNVLTKLIIPAKSFWSLRFVLDQLGNNASVLFPDLDGLCEHITWTHSVLPDENGNLRCDKGVWVRVSAPNGDGGK